MQSFSGLDLGVNCKEVNKENLLALKEAISTKDVNKETGAESAENGTSFLAIIKKIIAGDKDSLLKLSLLVKGAGNLSEKDNLNTLIENLENKDTLLTNIGKNFDSKKQLDKTVNFLNNKKANIVKDNEIKFFTGKEKKQIKNQNPSKKNLVKLENLKDNSIETNLKKLSKEIEKKDLKPKKNDKTKNSELAFSFVQENKLKNETIKNEFICDVNLKETKQTVKKEEKKAVIKVRDERKKNVLDLSESHLFEKKVSVNEDNSADISFNLKDGFHNNSSSLEASNYSLEQAAKKEQTFSSMLSQELRSNACDFVKTGQIVLRENNTGLIRLSLYPESLGSVKISLELSGDKKITGNIQVSSKEAWDAFNENLSAISDAFTEGGFESSGFNLSWFGSDSNQNDSSSLKAPFYSSNIPDVMSATNNADDLNKEKSIYGNAIINLFA